MEEDWANSAGRCAFFRSSGGDDLVRANMAYANVVESPHHAHAKRRYVALQLESIDRSPDIDNSLLMTIR